MTRKYFPSVEKIRYMSHRSTQPSQQKPGIEMGLSGKHLLNPFFSNGINAHDIHGKPQDYLDCTDRNMDSLGIKRKDTIKRYSKSHNSPGRNRLIKLFRGKYVTLLRKRKDCSKGRAVGEKVLRHRELLFPGLKT